jgi:hypothetical protein
MYPGQFFSLYPPFARDDRVFVAMSFAPRFEHRWKNVLSPGIESIGASSVPLQAHRVDRTRRSDSILIEILEEVARARAIVADISTIGVIDGLPVRNANVMYEVGLAHAARLPEEIILVRSDSDPLPFDVANVRVHSYDPDGDPAAAQEQITDLVIDALKSVQLRRSISVARAAESLDLDAWEVLYDAYREIDVVHPTHPDHIKRRGMLEAMLRAAAIQRLLGIGALQTQFQPLTDDFFGKDAKRPRQELSRYTLTRFGREIVRYTLENMLPPPDDKSTSSPQAG